MRLAEAAEYVRMDPETVRRAMAAGELRAVQSMRGGRWRTRVEWLDAWMAGETAALVIPRVTRPQREMP
jgi:excisionase family DNA binding protein